MFLVLKLASNLLYINNCITNQNIFNKYSEINGIVIKIIKNVIQ